MESVSTSFTNFDPSRIRWQDEALDFILGADYSLGTWEFLLSGAVGSAKTTLGAHLAVRHCMDNVGARCMIGRAARPDLKRTIYQEIVEHLDDEHLTEGVHYKTRDSTCEIKFPPWKSEMVPGFWVDKKYGRFRSMKLSMILLEELTETKNDGAGFYKELFARLNRVNNYRGPNLLVAMTNPDSPIHWAYERWWTNATPLRKVFYSRTADNPFLPPSYIHNLRESFTPIEAERMLEGKWRELNQERIYYQYDTAINFRKDTSYQWDPSLPVDLMFDFNIGFGKPMSAAVGQVRARPDGRKEYHVAAAILIDGARTGAMIEEIANRGFLDKGSFVRVHGDASGKSADTRNIKSDYDIIKQFLAKYRKGGRDEGPPIAFEMRVPLANPPMRDRHNMVNACCMNANKFVGLYLYKDAVDADLGFRLTNFKKGALLTEDDSFRQQHVTTAIGYWIHWDKTRLPPQKVSL